MHSRSARTFIVEDLVVDLRAILRARLKKKEEDEQYSWRKTEWILLCTLPYLYIVFTL
jgi:hypothetical protein